MDERLGTVSSTLLEEVARRSAEEEAAEQEALAESVRLNKLIDAERERLDSVFSELTGKVDTEVCSLFCAL